MLPMSFPITTILLTVLVLLVIVAVFAYFYVATLRTEIAEIWRVLLAGLRLRLDKIPNLVETVVAFVPDRRASLLELADLRSSTWPMLTADKKNVQNELEISAQLNQVWQQGGAIEALATDTNFLALKMEFKKIGAELEDVAGKYNERVRGYNGVLGNAIMAPFGALFRFKKLPIFEVEG